MGLDGGEKNQERQIDERIILNEMHFASKKCSFVQNTSEPPSYGSWSREPREANS
jgi:hypothetical protein